MLRADPYFLRSLGGTLVQASSYLRDKASRVQRGAEELLQGPTGWRGDAPQAFRTSCSLWHDDMLKICNTLERTSSTLSQLANRVEHIEQLRQEARQYENACWDLDPSNPQEQHQLQHLRSRARDLYAAAEMESMAADQQAASAFREMETVERSLNLMHSPVWQQYERNLLLSKLKGLSKSERMGYYDAELDEEVFLQDFGKMANDELRAQIRGREERQLQAARDETELVNQVTSTGLDFVPVVGNVKSAVEAITGKDYITGEELTKGGRILAAAGIIFGGLKTFGKVGRAADKGLEFARFGSLPKVEAGIVDLKKGSNAIAEGTGEAASRFNPLNIPKIAKEIEANPGAVYGYSPKKGSPLDKFGVDWTHLEQVASARAKRMEYLQNMEQKKRKLENEVAKLQSEGMSIEDIARMKVGQRNSDRMQSYIDSNNYEGLAAMKERNIQQYGRPEGPTPEQLFEKYGSWEEVIYSSVRTSPAMDVLTGLYKP